MADTPSPDTRWVARLTPMPGVDIGDLLEKSLDLDVWQRNPNELVVRAQEGQLKELERLQLTTVERLCTVMEWPSGNKGDEGISQT